MTSDAESVVIEVGNRTCELSRADAADLQAAIGDALTERREFFRTAGEYREDGSYVVSRRGADSAGNEKVFRGFDELRRLYGRLPPEFDADDVGRTGITGSRRHMVLRHFAEHPEFDCRVECRSPLRVVKAQTPATTDGVEAAAD